MWSEPLYRGAPEALMPNTSLARPQRALLILVVVFFASPATMACKESAPAKPPVVVESAPAKGHVIAGSIVDPQRLMPEDAILMVGKEEAGGSFGSQPVPMRADGSFVTWPLGPGKYVLEVVRSPHSRTKAATAVGFSLVTLGDSDVEGVTITIRPDIAVVGTFRMESDNKGAAWPQHIAVNAFLALDGMNLAHGTIAEGAAGGRFVLRNAFGPRVLRCGYTLAPGSDWWPTKVLLDGVDITNVPTDFSTKEKSRLEVVFTQHPARFAGTITDPQGGPVPNAWVVVFSAERALWQRWSTMSQLVRADAKGAFRFASLPGRYLARALPPAAFSSERAARIDYERLAQGATKVQLEDRELKVLGLEIDAPR